MKMSKKDYSLKFYKGRMVNDNNEVYNFYLAARSANEAYGYLENYVEKYSHKYHLIPGENGIYEMNVTEVAMENYGKSYGYEVIN